MATKKVIKTKRVEPVIGEAMMTEAVVVETPAEKKMKCDCKNCGRTAQVGWFFLLLGGLAHMLPAQMAPILTWSVQGISLQMAVGAISVVIGLYFLLGE